MRDSCVCGYFEMRPLVLDEQDEFDLQVDLFEDEDDSVADVLDEVHALELDVSGEKALYEFEMNEYREPEMLDDDLYHLLDSDYFEEDELVQSETINMDDILFDDENESLV